MKQWRKSFPGDVRDKEEFYAMKREERRVDHRRSLEFSEQELENPNSTVDFDSNGLMWDDLWTEATSSDEK
jgi:hypothetical protein